MSEQKLYKTFGEHLRIIREKAGLTLKEVAAHIEIDISLLAKIERNERQPTKILIKNIAHFFKMDEKELFNEFLSDQIAYRIIEEDADVRVLKVAEEKINHMKMNNT